ncbi:hypothetical protein Tco_0007236 [Tanacetum coccineum]
MKLRCETLWNTASTMIFTIRKSWTIRYKAQQNMDKNTVWKMKAFSHKDNLFITTTDKHGVPPTKRLFRVPTLDPSPEFIGPWGTSGDLGQPRSKSSRRPDHEVHLVHSIELSCDHPQSEHQNLNWPGSPISLVTVEDDRWNSSHSRSSCNVAHDFLFPELSKQPEQHWAQDLGYESGGGAEFEQQRWTSSCFPYIMQEHRVLVTSVGTVFPRRVPRTVLTLVFLHVSQHCIIGCDISSNLFDTRVSEESVALPSKNLSPVLEEEPAKKHKKAKKPAKKSNVVPTTGVVIKDTPGVSVSKKKAPAKGDRGKGMELLSDAALLEAAQVKEALQKSKKDSNRLHASGSGDRVGSQPKVLDELQDKTTGTDEGTGTKPGVPNLKNRSRFGINNDVGDDVSKGDDDDADGDSDNDASDNERTDSDEEENPNLTLKDDKEEETQDDEYVQTPDYYVPTGEETNDDIIDFNEEEYDELYKDVDVKSLDAEREKEGQDDVHVTLTTTQKTEGSMQSSSVSSDFASKFLNLDNVPPADNEVASMMKVKILPKEISDFATSVIQISINELLENVVLAKSSSQPQSIYKAAASLTEFELKKILLDKLEKSKSYRAAKQHRDLYDTLVKSYQLDKDLFDSYGKAYSLKRGREDKDKDEDPPTGSDQGLKKRKTSKDDEPPKGSKSKESKSSLSKGTKSQPKSSGKSVQADEPMFETANTEMLQDQGERPPTPDPDSNAGKQIDFRPPRTWISRIAQAEKPPLTFDKLMSTPINFSAYSRVELEYHFKEYYKAINDRLDWHNPEGHEYPFDLSKPLPLVEDLGRQVVPANYFFNNDLEYLKGGSSSRKYITSTTKTKEVKYDNIEGIEDMVPTLWSPVKKKLSNLERDDLYDLNMALRMFTRRVVILKRVEDLQLGVESYQKKLNITKPETFRFDISSMTPYTAYNKPQGIINQDKFNRNRLMRLDELYKFCDGTLTSVRRVLHDIASSLEMDYLPKRRWSKLDRKRSRIMIKAIDQQLFERRLMRNLVKFVGRRDYGNYLRLLERTI